ncbi:hypothetical protein pb186bvf_002103 [Paramecium bursaria]
MIHLNDLRKKKLITKSLKQKLNEQFKWSMILMRYLIINSHNIIHNQKFIARKNIHSLLSRIIDWIKNINQQMANLFGRVKVYKRKDQQQNLIRGIDENWISQVINQKILLFVNGTVVKRMYIVNINVYLLNFLLKMVFQYFLL